MMQANFYKSSFHPLIWMDYLVFYSNKDQSTHRSNTKGWTFLVYNNNIVDDVTVSSKSLNPSKRNWKTLNSYRTF